MISSCDCKHTDQDALHGKGRRVFNPCKPSNWPQVKAHRCTVCGKEKIIPEAEVRP